MEFLGKRSTLSARCRPGAADSNLAPTRGLPKEGAITERKAEKQTDQKSVILFELLDPAVFVASVCEPINSFSCLSQLEIDFLLLVIKIFSSVKLAI